MSKYIYAVLLEGELLYVSDDEDEAYAFIDDHEYKSIQETAEEYDWNIYDESEYERAALQNLIDSGGYLVEEINLRQLKKNDKYELVDGTLVDSKDILDLLKKG